MDTTEKEKTENKERAAMNQIAEDYNRYAAHGNTDHNVYLNARLDTKEKAFIPTAIVAPGGDCVINASDSYKNLADLLDRPAMADPIIRPYVIAHEDMHCRIRINAISDSDTATSREGQLAQHFDALSNESIADAMAILITAKRDGVEKALELIHKVEELRTSPGEDKIHNTTETLKILTEVIKHNPAAFATDASAFVNAIEIGMRGATMTFPAQIAASDIPLLGSKIFEDNLKEQSTRLSDSVATYRDGPKPDRISEITSEHGKFEFSYPEKQNIASIINRVNATIDKARDSRENSADAVLTQIKGIQQDMMRNLGVKAQSENSYLSGRQALPASQMQESIKLEKTGGRKM